MTTRPLCTSQPGSLAALFADLASFASAQTEVFVGTAGSLLERENAAGFCFYGRQFYDGEGKSARAAWPARAGR